MVSNVTIIGHSHVDYEDSGRIRKIIPIPGRCAEEVSDELPRQNPRMSRFQAELRLRCLALAHSPSVSLKNSGRKLWKGSHRLTTE